MPRDLADILATRYAVVRTERLHWDVESVAHLVFGTLVIPNEGVTWNDLLWLAERHQAAAQEMFAVIAAQRHEDAAMLAREHLTYAAREAWRRTFVAQHGPQHDLGGALVLGTPTVCPECAGQRYAGAGEDVDWCAVCGGAGEVTAWLAAHSGLRIAVIIAFAALVYGDLFKDLQPIEEL